MKLLKQKGSGEIYVWSKELAARSDMEEFVKEVPVETVQVEQADQETKPVEVVNEEETSVGSTEPQEAKQEAKPKSKSAGKGKR